MLSKIVEKIIRAVKQRGQRFDFGNVCDVTIYTWGSFWVRDDSSGSVDVSSLHLGWRPAAFFAAVDRKVNWPKDRTVPGERQALKDALIECIEDADGDGLILTEEYGTQHLAASLMAAIEYLSGQSTLAQYLDCARWTVERSAATEAALTQALRDIIASSAANDGDALVNAITAAQEILQRDGAAATGQAQSPDARTILYELAAAAARVVEDDAHPTLPHLRHLNYARQAASDWLAELPAPDVLDWMFVERDVLEHALTSLQDLSNGWPARELHEPLATTIERLQAVLGVEAEHA